MTLTPAQLDSFIKSREPRRDAQGRDIRHDPCPKCAYGVMHYQVMGSSHVFICDACHWMDFKR